MLVDKRRVEISIPGDFFCTVLTADPAPEGLICMLMNAFNSLPSPRLMAPRTLGRREYSRYTAPGREIKIRCYVFRIV